MIYGVEQQLKFKVKIVNCFYTINDQFTQMCTRGFRNYKELRFWT